MSAGTRAIALRRGPPSIPTPSGRKRNPGGVPTRHVGESDPGESAMKAEAEREYVEYVSARLAHLHRAAYLLCGDGHRADDIVQATLTALYRHWDRATAAQNIDAYVHRILVRRFLDEKR